jgi:1-acyl-sn-glycerol-3-phosphate acyltransferase
LEVRDRLLTAFYWLNVLTWVKLVLLIVTSQHIEGRENIPRKGPIILACNHFSVGDPPILTGIVPRRISWMAKQELFQTPVIGWLYNMFGCVPVRRFEADLKALRMSQEVLQRGHVLGMFPEGTRSAGRGLKKGEPGTAVIALRTGVPVLPVAIWGTENVKLPRDLFRRTRVWVRFGQPFTLPITKRLTKEQVEESTELIMRRIAALLPVEFRGVYSDVEPKPAATAGQTEG